MPKTFALKKGITITLALILLNNALTPGIAFALTSGPKRPESTSFEPVDTTDMVNMLSGDLAYNIPLLEIPGPEGGYPLSLSYHAGMQPEEEASWVGLGWTLNPGAIDRTVSGFPDDFNGQQNSSRDYWGGGKRTTTSVGVNVGLGGVLSADIGVAIGHDTFLGSGIGGYMGLSASVPFVKDSPYGATASLGLAVDPFGGTSMTGGIGAGARLGSSGNMSANASLGLSFSTNFESLNVGAGGGLSLSAKGGGHSRSVSGSLLGASMSSSAGGVNLSLGGGYNNVDNAKAGKIQTQSSGWGISIPVWFGVSLSLSHNYMRYWSDETSSVQTFGSLHPALTRGYGNNMEYDTYYLADIDNPGYILTDVNKNDPVKSTGGTLSDFDGYSVLGQGISGSMRPYGYQLELVGKAKNSTADQSVFQTNRQTVTNQQTFDNYWDNSIQDYVEVVYDNFTYHTQNPSKLDFRFTNDFSNRYLQKDLVLKDNNAVFDTSPTYGLNDANYGYDPTTERLASSKNIEYFTNDEIKNGAAQLKGFIDSQAKGFDRTKNPDGSAVGANDQRIGGFMVTNESGVTYHYALPVYSYNEYSKTTQNSDVTQFNEQRRPSPYATSWLLTAVTGPDYVDTNHNGKVDKGDWGYWADFEYGRWAKDYVWRTPFSGTNKDLDQKFSYFSMGYKELYYLDAIVTPSHTAIFSKEIRADGKGISDTFPVASAQLRLNDIILLNNKDMNLTLDQIRNSSTNYTQSLSYDSCTDCDNPTTYTKKLHDGDNIIDKYDIASWTGLKGKTIRDVKMSYDYSLCLQTDNSYDPAGGLYDSSAGAGSNVKTGKLTLTSLSFLGKQGQSSIPPTTFDYELPSDLVKQSSSITFQSQKSNSDVCLFQDPQDIFSEGDIVKFISGGITYYGLIKAVDGSHIIEVKYIGKTPPALSGSLTFISTKNPPYSASNHDMWGMYKADYQDVKDNENLGRLPSRASAKASDVWSLRRIHHSLGMTTDIVYEPDVYSKVALYQNASIILNTIQKGTGTNDIVVSSSNNFGVDLRDFIRIGDKVQLSLTGTYQEQTADQNGTPYFVSAPTSLSSGDVPSLLVTSVSEYSITINDAGFYKEVFQNEIGGQYFGGNLSAGGIGNNYGGGLRVKQIVNKEPITGVSMSVNYNYNYPGLTLSSGVTSYEPLGIDAVSLRTNSFDPYLDGLTRKFSNLLGLSRLIPGPGVMYEYVGVNTSRTVDGQTVEQLGSSQYQFEVFTKGMIGVFNESPVRTSSLETSNILIQNYSNRIGNLKRMIRYDKDGRKLNETINHYLSDEQSGESAQSNYSQYENLLNRYNKQGLIMERTAEGRYNDGKYRRVMTMNTTYPNVATGSTTIDYKTGLTSNTQTLGFDFYSGTPNKTLTFDSYGNRFITEITPAYRIYPSMGLRFNNPQNANMLAQTAQEVTYKADQSNNYTYVVSATANTWSNQSVMLNDTEQPVATNIANTRATKVSTTDQLNIWRPYQTYNWMPQSRTGGLSSIADFASYFNGGDKLAAWVKASEITLYNIYSNALEVRDINGNYGATMMGYNQSKVVANSSNANYNEICYAGLEDNMLYSNYMPRKVALGQGTIVNGISHTGDYSEQLNGGQSGLIYTVTANQLKQGRNYTASVWMKTDGNASSPTLYYKINGGAANLASVNLTKKAGAWYLVTLQIPGGSVSSGSTLEVGCINNGSSVAYFDDFRFKPVSSAMTSYVYDTNSGELTYILDNNNMFAQFQYDSEGRLTKTFKENFSYGVKQTGENQYHYANQ
ncbi:hypothetical protein [Pedobacter cryoconitis]|uniref:Uncharacterized protein n=1 Tax=Pedobacter cryoconitis TaxID=188932 RepID=A0A7X0MHP8_9SPHI|nr:hypothetical protein [Pedobacter cryoconitis]MBB6499354.1 hypothetical protein [Pedobacter cryoconitis]